MRIGRDACEVSFPLENSAYAYDVSFPAENLAYAYEVSFPAENSEGDQHERIET